MRAVEERIEGCRLCRLCEGRKNPVPGEGSLDSPVVLVGEAPGRSEDEQGKPFVGSAGRLLDLMLGHAGLGRGDVYITNVVKCRPPENRRPRADEVNECTAHLDEQLSIIGPRVLAPMGNSSASYFFKKFGLERASIGEVHGKAFEVQADWGPVVVFPLYHPAAALYNRGLESEMRRDFEGLKGALLGGAPTR